MNLLIRNNGQTDYKLMRKIGREETFEELKQNIKSKITEKLMRIDEFFVSQAGTR